jgi:RNA polymerase sigma-70 factor (sigma-E family)
MEPPRAQNAPDDFPSFVSREYSRLLRTAYLLAGNRAGAEDVLQDALLKTMRHWDRVSRADHRLAYVRSIVVREFLSRRRRLRVAMVRGGEGTVPPPDVATSLVLWECVKSLPTQQRSVVVLRYYEDLTERETAEVMGVSVGTVKRHHARAIARLRTVQNVKEGVRP